MTRERDPLAYYGARIDRFFDNHPFIEVFLQIFSLTVVLWVVYAISVKTGVWQRTLGPKVEPWLAKHVVPWWLKRVQPFLDRVGASTRARARVAP